MTIAPERPTRARTVHDLPEPDPDWTLHAACIGADFDIFVTGSERSRAAGNRNLRGRALCAGCDVTRDCLLAAVREDDRRSIRGGMSPAERDQWLAGQGIRRPGSLGLPTVTRPTFGAKGPYRTVNVDRMVAMHLGGASDRDIAAELECSRDTVGRRLKTARAQGLIP